MYLDGRSDLSLQGFFHPRQSGQYGENWSSLIGIVTAIVGNVLISFALNMQRYAHIRLDREFQQKRSASASSSNTDNETGDDVGSGSSGNSRTGDETAPLLGSQRKPTLSSPDKQQSYLTSPYWWAGIVLMTVGEAGNFLAYGFAPASIVSPLGVVALISNCIIAPFMLKERFRWRDAAGVVVAVGGAVTVVLSASDNNPKLGPDEIWGLIKRWEFETYLGVTVGVITILIWASNHYGEKNILIDLGLVGLFGMYPGSISVLGLRVLISECC
jgi:drug/metabolite transporter (DMT)-like permease